MAGDQKITWDMANSGDIKDDISMMGIYLFEEYKRRFMCGEKIELTAFSSVLKSFAVSAHREVPGCTDELIGMLRDAADWVEKDRHFIKEHKLQTMRNTDAQHQ